MAVAGCGRERVSSRPRPRPRPRPPSADASLRALTLLRRPLRKPYAPRGRPVRRWRWLVAAWLARPGAVHVNACWYDADGRLSAAEASESEVGGPPHCPSWPPCRMMHSAQGCVAARHEVCSWWGGGETVIHVSGEEIIQLGEDLSVHVRSDNCGRATLDLLGHKIGVEGARQLALCIAGPGYPLRKLGKLSLFGNHIEDSGLAALASVLGDGAPGLLQLDLRRCRITDGSSLSHCMAHTVLRPPTDYIVYMIYIMAPLRPPCHATAVR
eukprot:COSAG01_NODE_7348_length_3242_cov_1.709513_3_plen_269_part_00